jgi:hypothetical protein
MRYKRALIKCQRCGKWSGWISRTKGGVKRIDTTCSCCGARLRHTERRDSTRSYVNCYRPGRGAHNRTISVSRFIPVGSNVDVKQLAAYKNKKGQMDRAKHYGKKMTFVKGTEWDDVRLR